MQAKMSHVTVSTERRKEQRKRPLGLVYVELSSANGGMLRDLSERGFAMRAMMPLRVGDATPFRFSLDPETRLEGSGKVLWVEEDGRVAGFQFTEIAAGVPEKICAWLQEHSCGTTAPAAADNPVKKETSTLQELREELRTISPGIHDPKPEHAAPVTASAMPIVDAEAVPAVAEAPAVVALPKLELPENIGVEAAPDGMPLIDPLVSLPEIESIGEPGKINSWMSGYMVSLAVRMMIFLALLACAFVFHRPLGNAIVWLGMKIAGPVPTATAPPLIGEESSPQAMTAAANPPTASAESTTAANSGNEATTKEALPVAAKKSVEVPVVTESTPPAPGKNAPTSALVPLPATSRTTTFSAIPGPANEQLGQQEYLAAQELLKNKSTGAGLQEAVRLLWIAVEKGNSNAEVALAGLYRQGQGVAKSCDQTKILLTAAAHKGNAEARKNLEQFLQEGCE